MSGLVVNGGAVLDAVIALLDEELPSTIPVGDSGAPDPGDGARLELTSGYVTCDLISLGPSFFQSFTGANAAFRTVRVQMVGYGIQANQARWISNRCQEIVLGWDDTDGWEYELTPTGVYIAQRLFAGEVPSDYESQVHSHGISVDFITGATS